MKEVASDYQLELIIILCSHIAHKCLLESQSTVYETDKKRKKAV